MRYVKIGKWKPWDFRGINSHMWEFGKHNNRITLGRDLFNEHFGFTVNWREIEPLGDNRMWRYTFRLNFRTPINTHYRRIGAVRKRRVK